MEIGSNIKTLAASRIYIAVISSVIIYTALRGDIVGISILAKGNNEIPVLRIAFISAVAGFVESLVPNLLTRTGKQNDDSKNNNNKSTSKDEK